MPVWEAQYVIVIASITGWSEDFIRHRLPLSRGWAYFHAARLMEGEKCRWPAAESKVAGYLSSLQAWWRRVMK